MQQEIQTQKRAVPLTVSGWQLTDSSRATLQDGSIGRTVNYQDPSRTRVFVNISRPSVVKNPDLWRAQLNPPQESESREVIHTAEDFDEVFEAAVAWMNENPASSKALSQYSTDA